MMIKSETIIMKINHKISHKHRNTMDKMKTAKMIKISKQKQKNSKDNLKTNKHNLKTSKKKLKTNRLVKILKYNRMLIKMKTFELLFINDCYSDIN
jgi:hypothetical protein